jgi:uncharacterized coiled-coil protein SlyX
MTPLQVSERIERFIRRLEGLQAALVEQAARREARRAELRALLAQLQALTGESDNTERTH